jgi:hypothetical protein
MTRIIVLFNLRPGTDPAAYEAWARSRDIPAVRALRSIAGFEVAATTGLLMSDAPPPYAYVEVIDVADMDAFGTDVASPQMQAIAAEFRAFADDPVFMLTRDVAQGGAAAGAAGA